MQCWQLPPGFQGGSRLRIVEQGGGCFPLGWYYPSQVPQPTLRSRPSSQLENLVLPLSTPRVGGVKREWRWRRQDEWISWAKICHVGSICHWTISIYSKFSLILCITQVHIMVLWQCLQCKLYMHVLRPQNKKTVHHAFELYAGMLVCLASDACITTTQVAFQNKLTIILHT